ncbi:hypothetical protein [Amphibiibacter pelophylacis]|uniref:Uncharacterized protein n=1 Tax=Amphibiibacter pelophylacis TaxID=1799477 RepID=A0ACC6NZN6_9BURK
MNHTAARKIIFSIIVVFLVLSVLSWFPSPQPKDLGRLCINGVLCWFLFKGRSWARWCTVVFLVLAVMFSASMMIAGQVGSEKMIVLAVVSVVYLTMAGLLVFSKTVADYFSPLSPTSL